jgi:hypothetical protein
MGAASFSGPAAPFYLVEWYRRESVEESVEANAAKLDAGVASICAEGLDVRLLAILAVPTDEVVFGVFAGAADDITRACNIAGLPADRVSRADAARIDGDNSSAERASAELE